MLCFINFFTSVTTNESINLFLKELQNWTRTYKPKLKLFV